MNGVIDLYYVVRGQYIRFQTENAQRARRYGWDPSAHAI